MIETISPKDNMEPLAERHAVALLFSHCDQLTEGLPPSRMRPCWAHNKKTPVQNSPNGGGRLMTISSDSRI
jgi:hypothetical protein